MNNDGKRKERIFMIMVKRVSDPVSEGDGERILVDRLWPRGVTKEAARISSWMKELGPTTELRKWFGHDPSRWEEFRRRYAGELQARDRQESGIGWRILSERFILAAMEVWRCPRRNN
jgi:uncharacterized protein YeaO (DUF488 family)